MPIYWETYLLITCLMALATILLWIILRKTARRILWFSVAVVILAYLIPIFVIILEIEVGSIGAINTLNLQLLFQGEQPLGEYFSFTMAHNYFYKVILNMCISEVIGVAAGIFIHKLALKRA